MTTTAPATGDCFTTALEQLHEHPDWTMVHGLPLGNGGAIKGRRFWHAWIENDHEVISEADGGEVVRMPRAAFYALGRLDDTWVARYRFNEAMVNALTTGIYGPWDAVDDVAAALDALVEVHDEGRGT